MNTSVAVANARPNFFVGKTRRIPRGWVNDKCPDEKCKFWAWEGDPIGVIYKCGYRAVLLEAGKNCKPCNRGKMYYDCRNRNSYRTRGCNFRVFV